MSFPWERQDTWSDPIVSETALGNPLSSLLRQAFGGWALGSPRFVAPLRGLASGAYHADPLAPETRQLYELNPDDLCAAAAAYSQIDPTTLQRRGDAHIARAVAA